MNDHTITTTAGEPFTFAEHKALAKLIYKRFGYDTQAATQAWRRLLQNSTTVSDFLELLE